MTAIQILEGRTRWVLQLATVTLLTALFAATARARSTDWEFNLAPYFWAPDLDLNLRLSSEAQPFEEQFLGKDGNFKPNVGGATFSAFHKNWVFGLDGEALDADTGITLDDGRSGELEFQQQRADLLAGYEFTFTPYEGSTLYVSPYLGVRYRHLTLRVVDLYPPDEVDEKGQPVKYPGDGKLALDSGGSHWVEGMAGLRVQWFATPKWSVAVAGDADGLLNDQLSYTATGWVKWHWTGEFSISLGYRYNAFDFAGGNGTGEWEADGRAAGPMIGLELDFRGEPIPPGPEWTGTIGTTPVDVRPDFPSRPDLEPPPESPPPDEMAKDQRSGFLRWLDRSHAYLNDKLDAGVGYADRLMSEDTVPELERRKSRFFLELHTRVAESDSGSSFEFRPTAKADVKVPNLERELKLFISNQAVNEQRGTDVFDQEEGLNIGFATRGLFLKKTEFKLGARSSLDLFGTAAWKPEWRHNRWRVLPEALAYYRTDEGAGAIFSCLGVYRMRDRFKVGYLPSIQYREDENQWEWIQSVAATYIFEGNEDDYHRAFVTSFGVSGTPEEDAIHYLLLPLYYRAPLYKKWIYWEIGPEVRWKKIDRWEPEPGIRFAISTLFWGTEER